MPDGALLGILGILFYGILANMFYTGGWLSELLIRVATTTEKILLTLSPAVVCWLAFAVALWQGQKHGPVGE